MLVPVCLCAMPAAAQQEERIGNVDVYLEAGASPARDISHALLKPDAFGRAGTLAWACGGDPAGLAAGLHLAGDSSKTPPRVVWRFDAGAPDTTVLETRDGVDVALVGADKAGRIILRARAAERLAVQVLADLPGRPAAGYTYTLAGLDSALNRMGCTGKAMPSARNAGLRTMDRLMEAGDTVAAGAPPLGVEVFPSLRTRADFVRQLERNYPPLLRDAGVSGEVWMRFRVLENGRVDTTDVHVVRASHDEFVIPALRSLQALTFYPARINSRPVKVWIELPVQFAVDNSPAYPTNWQDLTQYIRRNYPRELRREGARGVVTLRYRVLPDGQVDAASIQVVSSADPRLNDIAIQGVQVLRYRPRAVEGPEGSDWVSMPILFPPP
ncbi:TonB family protein [Longimicrobium terrae]|uniref:TonB family protein n=1 Tax=Longimicrobium terrae TaxID=1639882 RepID=A0A841H506_9BACT|nr:TonB family protein [Longimicrobium terrae]MBB4638814.1 TonB family protein [Longimicrobium terrae]MBB6073053.1 TonB family protein [Longimicrobium terrae]NNC33176.1 TonB family protein [Longimicrobium terrae]